VSLHFGKSSGNIKTTIVVVQFNFLLLFLAMKIMVVYKYLISFVLLPQLFLLMFFIFLHVLFFTYLILIFFPSFDVMAFPSQIGEGTNFNLIIWPLHLKFVKG
jgi:hypothetical protein